MPMPSPATLAAFLVIVASVLVAALVAGVYASPPGERRRSARVGLVAALVGHILLFRRLLQPRP